MNTLGKFALVATLISAGFATAGPASADPKIKKRSGIYGAVEMNGKMAQPTKPGAHKPTIKKSRFTHGRRLDFVGMNGRNKQPSGR